MGPGAEEYLLPASRTAAEECEILFGADRHLGMFAEGEAERHVLAGASERMLVVIEQARARGVTGILVSGDPTLYSYLRVLQRRFSRDELVVYPGVSSLHVAACRLGLSLETATIVSVHGRDLSDLDQPLAAGGTLLVLTDTKNSPARVTSRISDITGDSRRFYVCENLTLPEERVTGPHDLPVEGEHPSLSIVVVEEKQ